MRRHDQGGATLLLLIEITAHVRRRDWVQAGRRLVAEDPVGLVERGADQRHLLRHAARIRSQDCALPVRELEALQQSVDALVADRLWNAIQVSEMVEVLRRGVAPVEPRLVGHHS